MLNQLVSPFPIQFSSNPLTIFSASVLDQDLTALRQAAPDATVRGSEPSLLGLTNQDRVIVFDRCGRVVYQQTLQSSDRDMDLVYDAILSARLQDPCGPCALPSQEEPTSQLSQEHTDQDRAKTASQTKVSNIANAYASPSTIANPTDAPEQNPTSTEADETTSKKPESKKNKRKRKKEKKEKRKRTKKGKRVEEGPTTPAGESETPDISPRDLPYEDEALNEILRPQTTQSPRIAIAWPMDKRDFSHNQNKKTPKQNRMELERQMEELIDIVNKAKERDAYFEALNNELSELERLKKEFLSQDEENYAIEGGLGGDSGIQRVEDILSGNVDVDGKEFRGIKETEDELRLVDRLLGSGEEFRGIQGAEDELRLVDGLLDCGEDFKSEDEFRDIMGNVGDDVLGGDEDYRGIQEGEVDLNRGYGIVDSEESVVVLSVVSTEERSEEVDEVTIRGKPRKVVEWPVEDPVDGRGTETLSTWREVNARLSSHGGDSSSDQSRRVVLYQSGGESESDSSVSGKGGLLHSKTDPWTKGKH